MPMANARNLAQDPTIRGAVYNALFPNAEARRGRGPQPRAATDDALADGLSATRE